MVERLSLYPISQEDVATANGIFTANVYLVSLHLVNNVVFPALRVTEAELGNDVDVLIGMDIIGAGDFAITHADGKTCLSFQIPSRRKIRFKDGPTIRMPGEEDH